MHWFRGHNSTHDNNKPCKPWWLETATVDLAHGSASQQYWLGLAGQFFHPQMSSFMHLPSSPSAMQLSLGSGWLSARKRRTIGPQVFHNPTDQPRNFYMVTGQVFKREGKIVKGFWRPRLRICTIGQSKSHGEPKSRAWEIVFIYCRKSSRDILQKGIWGEISIFVNLSSHSPTPHLSVKICHGYCLLTYCN